MGVERQKIFSELSVNIDTKDKDDQPFLYDVGKVLEDVIVQTAGGIVDATESAYNFVVPDDKEIEISDLVPEAETKIGQFVRPASQFFIPYTGAFKIAKGGYMFVKNAKNLNKTLEKLKKTKDTVKKIDRKTLEVSTRDKGVQGPFPKGTIEKARVKLKPNPLNKKEVAGLAVGAGALADGIAFAPYDPNVADFLVRFPATKNALTEWLQTDPNGDPGMERLKNAIAGGIPSVLIPTFTAGVAKGFVWSRNRISKKAIKEELDKTIKTPSTTKDPKSTKSKDAEKNLNQETEEVFKLEPRTDTTSAVGALQAKKSTIAQRLKSKFFDSSIVKRGVIQFLDSNAGLRFLEEAATKVGATVPRLKATYEKQLGVYGEARFIPAIGGMIEQFLFKGTFKFKDGAAVGTGNDGLQGILEKTLGKKHDPDEFFNYMGAKSLLSLSDTKFKGLFPKNTETSKNLFQKEVTKGDSIPEYAQALEKMNQFNSDLLDFAVDAGLITPLEKARLIKSRMPYVPLYRDMSVEDMFVKKSKGGGSAVKKQLKGKVPIGFNKGELPLRNLFDNYVENINSILTTSYKNYVVRNTFDLIDNANGALKDWATPAKGQNKIKKRITLKSEEIKANLVKQKGDELSLDINNLDDLDGLALFRSENIPLKDNQFIVFRRKTVKDPKTKVETEEIVPTIYDVNNEYLFQTLNAISPKQFARTNAWVRAAAGFKNLLTRGVTMDPGFFAGANLLRDTFSSAILSKNAFYMPMLSTAVKTVQRMTSNEKLILKGADGKNIETTYKELYQEFFLNGGSFGSTLWRGEVSEQFLKEFHRKLGSTNYKDVLNRPKKVLDRYGDMVTAFENASRYTEYALLRKSGMSAREAALAAREVAVDFGMHGANNFFRQYTSTVPFLNAGIQGIYRTVRALKNEGLAVRTAVVSKIIAYVGVPSLVLHTLNRDDEDYKNTSQQIRDMNYMIPLGEGNFLKIPKPFEFGAVGTIATGVLELFDNSQDADRFFLTTWTVLKNQFRLSYVPQVLSPIVNTAFNKTFFGSPVISENMKNSLPDYGQSYPWTSKSITSAIENTPPSIRKLLMSPIEFENYYRAYTGAVGGYVLDLIDETVDIFSDAKMPDKRLDEYIFVKRFLQLDPAKFTQAEADFYEFKKQASQAFNQMKKFKDEGKVELLKEFLSDPKTKELVAISPQLENLSLKASKTNKERNRIINDKAMTGAAKRFKIDLLEKQMAIYFKDIMDAIDEADLEVREPFFSFK